MKSTRYRHKPIEIEAIPVAELLAAKANGTMDLAPKWVKDAIFENKLDFPTTTPAVAVYPLPGVPRFGSSRDYLTHSRIGTDMFPMPKREATINVCPPEALELLYEMVDP